MRDGLALAAFIGSLLIILAVLVLRAEPEPQSWFSGDGDDVEVVVP